MNEILVPFHGEGSGVSDMTWGQKEIWWTMQRTGRTLNIGGAVELSAGLRLDEVTGMLRFLVSRHQALRTRLRFSAEAALPQQEVAASGEVPLWIVDAEDDPAAAAEAMRAGFETAPFSLSSDWPVRWGVIRRDGVLTHLAVQYSHVMVDGFGIAALVRDLALLGSGQPAQGTRPLSLAAVQASPAGHRQSQKSLRYWENQLQRVRREPARATGDEQEQRFWEIFCYSPAMHLALQVIAARTGTDTSHVLLAACAVALARVTGQDISVLQVVVSNRFRPGFRDAVAQLSQPGICVIDTSGCRFNEVVARSWKAATAGTLHGYHDPYARAALLAKLAQDNGGEFDISCFINDRRTPEPLPPVLPAVTEIRDAMSRTVVRWDRKQPTFDGRFYLQVDSAPDANVPGRLNEAEREQPAVYFALWADTRYLSPAHIESCARELEAVTVEAALDA